MGPTSSIRNANELGCGCREKCSCRTILDCYDQQMKSHRIGVDYWSTNPCQPWVTSLFSSNASAGSHRTNSTVGMLYDNRGSYQRGTLNVAINNNTVSFMSSQTITRNDEFPAETRRSTIQKKSISTSPIFMPRCDIIGHPSLRIYKFKLPTNLLHLLDYIVKSCNSHALSLQRGWATYLYSLTKQDIAVRDVGGLYEIARPIVGYIKKTIESVYGVHSVRIDRNQPHVLKYSCEDGSGHTGVQLHHDKCDLTANIMLSRSSDYSGGGTYFPDANTTSKLEFGEFLIHPGNLVHAGIDITRGTRYLMVIFTHTETR